MKGLTMSDKVNVVHVHVGGRTPTPDRLIIGWFNLFMMIFCLTVGNLIFAGVSWCLGDFREEIVLVRNGIWDTAVWFANN
jgi:hypothetical protein